MKTIKNKILLVLFIAAAGFFIFESFNVARATLIESEEYDSQFEMYDIGVTLNENGEAIAWRNYNGDDSDNPWSVSENARLMTAISKVRYGEVYNEVLSVTNSGQVDEYVRVTIYKYWVDEDGNKTYGLDPELIKINLSDEENWIEDEDYRTDERTVLYYILPLTGSESGAAGTTENFMESVMLDGRIKNYVIQSESEKDTDGYTVVTNVYKYDGKTFCIDVEVDAIQTHNAEDASLSAWGRQIKIDETTGELSLVKEDKD